MSLMRRGQGQAGVVGAHLRPPGSSPPGSSGRRVTTGGRSMQDTRPGRGIGKAARGEGGVDPHVCLVTAPAHLLGWCTDSRGSTSTCGLCAWVAAAIAHALLCVSCSDSSLLRELPGVGLLTPPLSLSPCPCCAGLLTLVLPGAPMCMAAPPLAQPPSPHSTCGQRPTSQAAACLRPPSQAMQTLLRRPAGWPLLTRPATRRIILRWAPAAAPSTPARATPTH